MTQRFKKKSHSLYECKYHIVFCPKYRYRIFKEIIGETVRQAVSISTVQAERTNRSARAECAARPCASRGVHTAKVFGIGIHGLSERKDGLAIVPTI